MQNPGVWMMDTVFFFTSFTSSLFSVWLAGGLLHSVLYSIRFMYRQFYSFLFIYLSTKTTFLSSSSLQFIWLCFSGGSLGSSSTSSFTYKVASMTLCVLQGEFVPRLTLYAGHYLQVGEPPGAWIILQANLLLQIRFAWLIAQCSPPPLYCGHVNMNCNKV